MTTPIGISFNVTANGTQAVNVVNGLNTAVKSLSASVNALNLANVSNLTRGIVAPKFQWQDGIRQTDQLVKNIQKGKLSATEFFQLMRRGTDDIVQQQARLSRAFSQPLGGGATAMVIPSVNDMRQLVTTTEMANRQLGVQAEIMRGLGQKVQDWGKNTQWAGRQMMVGMTVPFAMGAAAAGMYANKIDAAMVRVEKVVDEPLEGFRDKAMNTAKEITNTMGQTVESSLGVMSELAAAGMTGPMLQQMTKLSQTLATLGDMDQQEAIKGMISIQQIYKMSVEELSDAVNYLNNVEDATPTKLQDLVDAIPIAGTMVAQLGGTLQDTTVLLTAFRERGIETVEGANAIKTAMNRILSPTRGARDTFKELTGKDLPALVAQTEGKPLETFRALSEEIMGTNLAASDQQRIISKLVGTYQSSRITALLAGLRDPGSATAKTMKIGEAGPEAWAARTAKAMNAITSSASGQWKIAIESFKAELLETGQVILKVATVIVQGATKVFEFFNNMPDVVKGFLLGGAGLVALAGPITMIVGIFANFAGTVGKVLAVVTGMRSKYKSMTIEERAAELAAGNLNTKMMTQAEQAQILVYQMDKLKAAYIETAGAANMAANANGLPGGGAWNIGGYTTPGMTSGLTMPIGGKPMPGGGAPLLGTNAWAAQTNTLLASTGSNMQNIATQTQQASRWQKAFSQESLVAVGAVTAIAGMTTDAGSALSDWLNWISLGSVALAALLPLVQKIGGAIKTWATASAVSNLAGGLGNAAKGFGGKILSGGKAALGGLLSFIMGPWGIAVGGALIGIFAVTKLISAAQEEQDRHQRAMTDSTKSWTELLGKTKLEWGQIRTESGEVKDNTEAIINKMREKLPDLVAEMGSANVDYLKILSEREVIKLQGQDLPKEDIMRNMRAMLQAAGRTKEDIDKIMSHIEVRFDFKNGQKDIDAFLNNTRGDLKRELNKWLFEMPVNPRQDRGAAGERSEQQDQTAERLSKLFYDRLAGADSAQRAILADAFAKETYEGFNQSFEVLDSKYGDKLANSWAEARKKFFSWNTDDNKWEIDRAGAKDAGASDEEIYQMEIMVDTEQRLTQAIARTLKVSDDKVKKMSVIGDIMPYVAEGNITAKDAQNAYNKAVKEAAENGNEMTKEEKLKLAQLLAAQFGLDAATLASNGYGQATEKVGQKSRDAAADIQAYMNEIKNIGAAVEDFWNQTATGSAGFEGLGGTPEQQGQMLTEQVKGIYTGAMNDIYSAFQDQAQEQWQARLDAIASSFEARKEAVQRQIDAADKAYEAKQQAFQDRWDERMERVNDRYEARREAIEKTADRELESIDKQIDAEQEREDARQRQFEAEERRIERLTELANRSIDYNRALATGDLDEAARVMNNAEAIQGTWRAQDAKDQSSLMSKQQIDALNARKDLVQKQKEAKLNALKEEEEAVTKSLQKQREAEQRSMERSREIERERLQNKLNSLSKEQQAAEKTERAKQAMDRRTLEIELATLKAFVPKNEAELNAHVKRVSSAYANYGLNLQTAGGYWGTIVGNALQNNVNRARQEMSNNAAWAAFGQSVAGAISKGAFGLSLKDFFKLIATGQPPKGWKPPGQKQALNTGKSVARPGGRMFFHDGGLVGTGTSTQGRGSRGNSPLGGDEIPTVLQRGEYVFPKSAVELYGSAYLTKMAAGTPGKPQQSVGIGGMFGSVMGAMSHGIVALAMENLMNWASMTYGGAMGLGPGIGLGLSTANAVSSIIAVAQKFLPGAKASSTVRNEPGSWHHTGNAVDFGMNTNGGSARIEKLAQGFMGVSSSLLELIYSGGRGYFIDNGKPHRFNAGTVADHYDHVHVAARKDAMDALLRGGFGAVGNMPMGEVQRRVQAVAAGFGWGGGAQWNALYRLIQGESSWNPNAANPTSSARGLFQKMTSLHGPIENTVEGQARWGLNYIRGAYGDPITAFAKWSSRSPHWYDSGGDVKPGPFFGFNGTNMTESMVSHGRTSQLIGALEVASITYRGLNTRLDRALPNITPVAAQADAGYNGINIGNININGSGLDERQLKRAITEGIQDAKVKELKRTGKIK